MIVCPCCGHKTGASQVDIGRLQNLEVTNMQGDILKLLIERFPRGVGFVELIDRIYTVRADGGPDCAEECLKVQISRLRKRLASVSWCLPKSKSGRGNHAEYRLKMLVGGK